MKNILAEESSAYLKQHAKNPVAWQTWCSNSFELSKKLDRPVFLSSGYSSCYWCHVMEHECFDDQDIAEILNNFFIPIKIDREELPVVDEIYMDALSALGRGGGWPLSMFLDTDLKPFFGGTYFPKEQFIEILKKIAEYWVKGRSELVEVGNRVQKAISVDGFFERRSGLDFETPLQEFKSKFDPVYGGFSKSPKFPPAVPLNFLITAATKNRGTEEIIEKTLQGIILGGLQDHVEGGFHRYCVDQAWNIPHFEKMLYDNAQITRNLIEAYKLKNSEFYKVAIINSLKYLESQILNECFTSSIDAGDAGKEGEYYVFEEDQLKDVDNYLEDKVHLRFYDEKTYLDFQNSDQKIRLLEIRKTKEYPRRDLKVITSWNALAIKTFILAEVIDPKYLKMAEDVFESLIKMNYKDELLRTQNSSGTLEDYSYLISTCIELYRATMKLHYLEFADKLATEAVAKFWDEDLQAFIHSRSNELIIRKFELVCNVIPCPNAVMLDSLRVLNIYNIKYVRNEYDLNARFESAREYAFYMPTYLNSALKTYYVLKLSTENYMLVRSELPENSEIFYIIDETLEDVLICDQASCNQFYVPEAIIEIKKKLL